jgi:Mannosyltransferase (PIG-V)
MTDDRPTLRARFSGIGSGLSAWARANATPLIVFIASRIWLVLIVAASILLVPEAQQPAEAMRSSAPARTLRTLLVDPWTHWDGEWYRRIAVDGYTDLPVDESGQRDTAFFPLYPITVRMLAAVVGDVDLAGLLVSNAALLTTLVILYRLVQLHAEPAIARGAILLLAFFPFSYFLGAMYSESLFLLAIVAAFTFGEQERWWAAGLAGALAGLTRVTGVLIVPGLVLLYLERRRFDLRRCRWDCAWILAALLGPALHAVFLQARFGDAFLFIKSQYVPGWGAGVDLAMALDIARAALTGSLGGESILPRMHALHLLAWLVGLGLSFLAWGRPRIAYGAWATMMVLASFSLWRSAGRYAVTLFPLFMVGATLISRRRLFAGLLLASALALIVLAVLFAHSIWTG